MARLILAILIAIFCCILLIACESDKPELPSTAPMPFLGGTGAVASTDYRMGFPTDHAGHPEFDIEWWYLTSNLSDDNGNEYAFQWTLFRFANREADNSWDGGQIYMGHASLHSDKEHWFNEKFASGGSNRAGVQQVPLNYFIDNWYWQSDGITRFPSTVFADIALPNKRAKISLSLESTSEFVLHGEDGYSIKTADQSHASHYYSQPFIKAHGTLEIEGKRITVSGSAWYDHEWSSQLVNTDTLGWDWVSLHLDSGDKLMAFRMRTEGSEYVTGTHISSDGRDTLLLPEDIDMQIVQPASSESASRYPLSWRITVPSMDLTLQIEATKETAENKGVFSYYEGPVVIEGSHQGRGFLEMTGY